jgi:hypothetical protein
VHFLDPLTGGILGRLADPTAEFFRQIAFSPDGKHLMTLEDGKSNRNSVKLWKLTERTLPVRK